MQAQCPRSDNWYNEKLVGIIINGNNEGEVEQEQHKWEQNEKEVMFDAWLDQFWQEVEQCHKEWQTELEQEHKKYLKESDWRHLKILTYIDQCMQQQQWKQN